MNVGFFLSFAAGLASVISPCVLPLIPIVVGHSLLRGKTRDVLAFIIGFFPGFCNCNSFNCHVHGCNKSLPILLQGRGSNPDNCFGNIFYRKQKYFQVFIHT